MSWVLLVVIGASLNAFTNFVYKTYAPKVGLFYMMGSVMAVGAMTLATYAYFTQPSGFAALFAGSTPYIILAMGVGMAIVWIVMLDALIRGPLSVVDPLWACIYALGSVAIGMVMANENPSWVSLAGVALYLIGAVLMALSAKKPA